MNSKNAPPAFFLFFLMIAQLACSLPANSATPDTFATLDGIYTASALTLQAGSPQPASTATSGLPLPTATLNSAGISSTSTPVPQPVSRCDAAQFVADVTYADGSLVTRNSGFTKIWRIQNTGTCTWTSSYALVFSGGDQMSAPASVALARTVRPGETADLQISFTAPNKDGSYRGYWKLRNASGVLFGIGDQASTAFWVDVRVKGGSFSAYEFAPQYCSASWENNDTSLPCPGAQSDSKGFVMLVSSPTLENGSTDDEPALFVYPQDRNNGIISGQFPAFTVQAGDRFRTIIGCQYGASKCNVVFRLDYKQNGQVKNLGTWYEAYEGLYYPIDLDLSHLAGETVKFILTVGANGGNNQDYAFWLNPYIMRPGVPTPTLAPSLTPTKKPTKTPTATPTNTSVPPTVTEEPPTPTEEPPTETPSP